MPKVPSRNNGKVYIGIDPGQNGGLVAIMPKAVVVTPMPSTERDVWSWISRFHTFYGESSDSKRTAATIEHVHSMPKQGVASSFKFGMGFGGLRMALVAAGIPFESVTPQTWMKGLGIPSRKKNETGTQWKDKLRARAQQLFPDLECWSWNVGQQRCISDALLMALYCKRKHEGTL